MTFLVQDLETIRPNVHRTSGRAHGVITRLASPHGLGALIKPFVFLDLLDTGARGGCDSRRGHVGVHPVGRLRHGAKGSSVREHASWRFGRLT